MALKNNKGTDYGINATYFKITETHFRWHKKEADIILAGFIDKDARLAGKEPIEEFVFHFDASSFFFDPDKNNLVQAYDKIKTLDNWTDSVDI